MEGLLRELAPQALVVMARRHRDFAACEDAVQEALLAASLQWPRDGVPALPRAWLVSVAERRLIDELRSAGTRRRREERETVEPPPPADPPGGDDTLTLLFLCCHPALSVPSQLALTLRAVGGLTTPEIARAFLVPEATMAQRISRAKASIREAGARFETPTPEQRGERVNVVLHVLYLIFNEGYVTSGGQAAQRTDLAEEAIRLARLVHRLLPEEGETAGLLALMLLTHARSAARTTAAGALVPLAEQDRGRWDQALIAEGVELLTRTLGRVAVGPYQLQGAIAAVHDEAPDAAATDWPQILALYGALDTIAPGPVVTLNRAVAVAAVHGPRAGLALLGTLDGDSRLAHTHRLDAVRGHLLALAGEREAARDALLRAAARTPSLAERHHLGLRAAALAEPAE